MKRSTLYRLQLTDFSTDLKSMAEGALNTNGRWHTKKNIIYTSESSSLAILELLTKYVKLSFIKRSYNLIGVKLPEDLSLQEVKKSELPQDWKGNEELTQEIGNKWFSSKKSCLLKVPSVHTDEESNYLINIQHPQFKKIPEPTFYEYNFDKRFH